MKAAAIVPVKTFARAKSRMNLGGQSTAKLCTIMLREVLDALAESACVGSVAVVTREPSAEAIASEFGAESIRDESESGVNDAVALGDKYYAGRGFDATLVVPQDIPLLISSDVDELVRMSCAEPAVTVVPSRLLDGTNALLRAPSGCMRTRYDEGSYRMHMQEARSQKIDPVLVYRKRIMMDIDSAADAQYCAGFGEKAHVCEQIVNLIRTK